MATRRRLSSQRGQTMYILVIALTAMLMAVGLAIDGGLAFYYQSRLDTATRAAADAGTAVIWEDPEPPASPNNNSGPTLSSAVNRAQTIAALNGVPDGGPARVVISVITDGSGRPVALHVHTTYVYPVFFIRLLTKEPAITLSGDADGNRPGVP